MSEPTHLSKLGENRETYVKVEIENRLAEETSRREKNLRTNELTEIKVGVTSRAS